MIILRLGMPDGSGSSFVERRSAVWRPQWEYFVLRIIRHKTAGIEGELYAKD
jgi:hypothetical protein